MILVVEGAGRVRLDEPGELRRLSAVVGAGGGGAAPAAVLVAALVADVDGLDAVGDGLAATPELLRRLAGPLAADAGWRERLDAAVRYAQEHGWWDAERQAVLVHVER